MKSIFKNKFFYIIICILAIGLGVGIYFALPKSSDPLSLFANNIELKVGKSERIEYVCNNNDAVISVVSKNDACVEIVKIGKEFFALGISEGKTTIVVNAETNNENKHVDIEVVVLEGEKKDDSNPEQKPSDSTPQQTPSENEPEQNPKEPESEQKPNESESEKNPSGSEAEHPGDDSGNKPQDEDGKDGDGGGDEEGSDGEDGDNSKDEENNPQPTQPEQPKYVLEFSNIEGCQIEGETITLSSDMAQFTVNVKDEKCKIQIASTNPTLEVIPSFEIGANTYLLFASQKGEFHILIVVDEIYSFSYTVRVI